jgi:hypothetical protein
MLRTMHDSIRGSRSFKGLTAGGTAIRTPDWDWACGALIRKLLYLLPVGDGASKSLDDSPSPRSWCLQLGGSKHRHRIVHPRSWIPGSRTTLRTLTVVASEMLGIDLVQWEWLSQRPVI